MRIPARITHALFSRMLLDIGLSRRPDFVVGGDNPAGAYLNRWYVTPWRGWYQSVPEAKRTRWQRCAVRFAKLLPNVYLHEFLRDDDDRALHDHPWFSISLMLHGSYIEHTIAPGGIHRRVRFDAGSLRCMTPRHAHRVELLPPWWMVDDFDAACDEAARNPSAKTACWTLFFTSPVLRHWGFHCPTTGWVPWRKFTKPGNSGDIGAGCDA